MATLLETLQELEEDARDAWLESLTFEEQKELWVQSICAMVDVILSQMITLFGPVPREATDGD